MFRKTLIAVVGFGSVLALANCSSDKADTTAPQAEVFKATLSGANERPTPNNSAATGSSTVRLNADGTITYDLTTTGMTPSAQHIHAGDANTAGPVMIALQAPPATNVVINRSSVFAGVFTYDSLVTRLRNGTAYVNVHSQPNFAGGEIRGQLLKQ